MRVGGSFLEEYIKQNFRVLFITFLLFTVGVVVGSFYCSALPQSAEEALYGTFVGQAGLLHVSDSRRVFTAAFVNYLRLWVFLSLCGTCSLGIVFAPVLIGVRGFVSGFCVSALLVLYGFRGLGAAAAGVLPQLLLVLPAMQMLSVGAIRQTLASAQTTDRSLRRSRFFTYCMFCCVLLAVFAAAALYEGYAGWLLILKVLS